jgi:uncharacterized protein
MEKLINQMAGHSIASVGCSVALSAQAATTFTGDKVEGYPVVNQLDVNDLEPGTLHRFMFQGVAMGTGQHWYVPVMVAKGTRAGKKILLVAGIHGDELSPVRVVQRVFADLDPKKLAGTVIAILGPNRPGMEYKSRKWQTPGGGGSLIDFNRVWPGEEFGDAPHRQAWFITNRLFKDNVDIALDFHTSSTGSAFTFFIFADYRNAENQRLAELFPAAQIKDDPGLTGTLETMFFTQGVPAITVELGGPRSFDQQMIEGGVEGAKNVLSHYQITDEKLGRTATESKAFFGNKLEKVASKTGGFVELSVGLGDAVKTGQKLATQLNAFGDVIQEYTAPVDGQIALLATDAVREPGAMLVSILANDTQAAEFRHEEGEP